MTFWDQVGKAIGSAADGIQKEVKTAGRQYELGKLEQQIERQYVEMGKRAHELYRQRQLIDADIEMIAKRIAGLEEQVDELRKQSLEDGKQPEPNAGVEADAARAPQPVTPPPTPEPRDSDDDDGMPMIQ